MTAKKKKASEPEDIPFEQAMGKLETIVGELEGGDLPLERSLELFEQVQVPSPKRRLKSYPHELSGGLRQRAMIALALSCRPSVLLADEPTTALDATVQIQILLLLRELQKELGMGVIFVTHDSREAVRLAQRILILSRRPGRILADRPIRLSQAQRDDPATVEDMRRDLLTLHKDPQISPTGGLP